MSALALGPLAHADYFRKEEVTADEVDGGLMRARRGMARSTWSVVPRSGEA